MSSRDSRESSGSVPLRDRHGWRERLARWRGSPVQVDLRDYAPALAEINRLEDRVGALDDRQLDAAARAVGNRARTGAPLDELRAELFACAREISHRALGMRPFDVQVVAALALDRGAIVEMQTGEGKTLAAVMPAALNALTGNGVHVLTFNDYLARRDADWMRPVYTRLGVSVGFVQQGMTASERQRAYRADVTYVTAKEAGFDHLRDMLALDPAQQVHRPFHFALIDEADSLLIDEARVPLVIAGRVDGEVSAVARLAKLVAELSRGQHFDTDEYGRDVELTEAGIERVEQALGCGSLHDGKNYALLTQVNCALHAHALLRRDVDYLVSDGRIRIIDEFTGRLVPDRHWPDGLQAALEAKEGLVRQGHGRILGSTTLQHFIGGYPRLCGMTGTAQPAAAEFGELYELPVVVIPTNRPAIRVDRPDTVFTHREAKEAAVVAEIVRAHAAGRPVLVGTVSVEESERLAAQVRLAGIACEVLNARNDEAEARIVAGAGATGAVTISTNMAGRGTDIRLGGPDETGREAVIALGGLYIVGTNRHESRRVDLQLRGRAGRQGDPGESGFFISLEDELLVQYGIQGLLSGRFARKPQSEPIDHPVVIAEVARAQRIIEGQNFQLRRTLWQYASVVEHQRQLLMDRRQAILLGREAPDIWQRNAPRRASLVAAAGEEAVREAERIVTLHGIDTAWSEHLALIADVREGIHLVALGGQDPLTRFTSEITMAFNRIEETLDERVLAALERVAASGGRIDLKPVTAQRPASTWTYAVHDDPFQNQIGRLLTGPGKATFAIGGALFSMPLMILWGMVNKFMLRRKMRNKGNPSQG
jgi:preprotein translocase subunit SecA